ncbi:MAG: YceI family protein [Pseudomonadota bacterium]
MRALTFRHALAGLGLSLVAGAALAAPAKYEIDPSHTTLGFWVSHIGYAKTWGQFTEVSGSFVYDDETQTLTDLSVTVPTASVNTHHEARDGHVKNADFLDVGAHPQMTFTATGGEVTGDNTGKVTGDLTLLGITKPVTLDVTLNKVGPYPFGHKKETMGISARGTVKRSEFGMTYALGGIVGDEVEIVVEMEAIKAE